MTESRRPSASRVQWRVFEGLFEHARRPDPSLTEALRAIDQNPLAVTTKPFDTRRGEQAPQLTQASK